MDKKNRIRFPALVGIATIGFVFLRPLAAGPIPLPFRAELDRAKLVLVGKITSIVKENNIENKDIVLGRATLKVSEVLKGEKIDQIQFDVAVKVKPNIPMASPPRVYHEGDEGIWLIMPEGALSSAQVVLDKEKIKAMLAELDKRTWSQEANGLKVWASFEDDFYGDGRKTEPSGVIFAIRNVTDKTIFLPHAGYKGIVTVSAHDSSGKELQLSDYGQQREAEPPLSVYLLEPGETCYFHSGMENYSFFWLPRDMPSGTYSITVKLANSIKKGSLRNAGNEKTVTLWTGSVETPEIKVEIPSKVSASQPATSKAPSKAEHK